MTRHREGHSPWFARRVQGAGLVFFLGLTAVTGGLAVPFVLNESIYWADMNAYLLLGTVSLTVAVFCHACVTFSPRDASVLFVLAFSISLVAEYAGIRWGEPFGSRYQYHEDLLPRVAGGVPLFIPLSWFVLAYAPLVFLRRFEGGEWRNGGSQMPWAKVLLCSLGLVATDLFLDPLAISVHAWTWAEQGQYLGVPLRNYFGWFVVGFLIYSGFFCLRQPRPSDANERVFSIDGWFVLACTYFTVLALGALWQRIGSVLPLALAMITLMPYFVYWLVATRRLLVRPVCEDR